jgi:hypothetical protein
MGYLSFYESNDSDHRGIFIDLEESITDTKVELQCPPKRYRNQKQEEDHIPV